MWRRTIPLSQGYRVRADAYGTLEELRAAHAALAAVAMVRELQSQELDVEAQAGGRAIATQFVVSDSVKDVRE